MANEVDYSPREYWGNGTTREFGFDWKVLEKEDLIITLIDGETETVLTIGSDYQATIESVGGVITLTTAPASTQKIRIERLVSNYQGKRYSTSTGFQGDEVEKSFDRVSCNLQDMQHNIDTFKSGFSAEVNETITENQQAVETEINEYKDDTDSQISSFESEVNSKIAQVNEAVQKLNRLDEVLEECENYATTSEEQSIIATQQATQAGDSATSAEQALSEIQTEHAEIISDMQSLRQQSVNDVLTTKSNAEAEIRALGIYMQNNRLFYKDTQGITHEFRNDFGGIAPMAVKHKEIQKVEDGFALTWSDPDDSVYEDNVYCTWGSTTIVRKLGSYPEDVYDGDIVLESTNRNEYAETPYIDEVDNTLDYKYRAFPRSINLVYSYDDFNKFGQWIYSMTRIMNESVPSKKIVYRGVNEHYNPAYMNYSSDTFNYGDWENAPFLSRERLLPCTVFNGDSANVGEISQILDRNNYRLQEDGTASEVTDTSKPVNAFMRIKLLFRRKRKDANGNTLIDISNEQVNNEYKPYGSFVKPDGTLREYIFLPIYRGALISSKVRSMSGGLTPMNSQTAPNERTYCKNNGTGHDMITHADRELIEDLTMLMFRTTDLQSALGQGKSNGGSSVSDCLVSGTMDSKGLFYGSTSTAVGVKLFGMENRYASQWERVLGEVLVNGVRKVKLCQGTSDGSTVTDFNFDGSGYITLSELPTISGTSGGYISKEQTVDDIGTFPVVISGSSSTYECDGMWFDNSGTMVAFRGGSSNDGAFCGLFCSSLDHPASTAYWYFGSSVSYKPL